MNKLRAIICDDQADYLLLLHSVLRDAGFEVMRAYGGQDVVRKIATFKPDIVLTDLEMPGFGGVEVIEALKKDPATQGVPIVAVSSHSWDLLMDRAVAAGCNGFVSKPFDAKRLLAEIDRCINDAASRTASDSGATGLRLASNPPSVIERNTRT